MARWICIIICTNTSTKCLERGGKLLIHNGATQETLELEEEEKYVYPGIHQQETFLIFDRSFKAQ